MLLMFMHFGLQLSQGLYDLVFNLPIYIHIQLFSLVKIIFIIIIIFTQLHFKSM